MARWLLLLLVTSLLLVCAAPTAQAGQYCTTVPKHPVDRVVWAVSCTVERLPVGELEPDVAVTEVDLRQLNSCPGPWGHEERTEVGPVVVVTYECDSGDI